MNIRYFILLQPASYVARLKCHLSTRNDPFYALQPVKMEVMHLNPEIILFHEVISEKEMNTVKDIAGPLVKHSKIIP